MDLLRTLYKETSPSDYTPEFEKAYEKLDFYKITYSRTDNDWIEIPISQTYRFRVPTKKLPLLVTRLEQMCDDSLRETRAQVFKASLFDYLQSEFNKTESKQDKK